MEVLIAPDKFAGTMTAAEAAAAMGRGWSAVRPDDGIRLVPLADGGPGFLAAVAAAVPARRVQVTVHGPLGATAAAEYLRDGADAYIESAQAAGLPRQPRGWGDAVTATTAGVGELIAAAAAGGATRVVVGLGGSATTDGGAGALGALGAVAQRGDGSSADLSAGGAALSAVARIDLRPARRLLHGVELVLAADVAAPLLGPDGAARGYSPQKGADADQVAVLESSLSRWAGLLAAAGAPVDPAEPGSGAAGGLGFGLMAVGATSVSGMEMVAGLTGLGRLCRGADLVVTGEGRLDWQSAQGKVVGWLAGTTAAMGTPLVVVAGQSDLSPQQWAGMGIADVATAAAAAGSTAAALADPQRWAAVAAERLARGWVEAPALRHRPAGWQPPDSEPEAHP